MVPYAYERIEAIQCACCGGTIGWRFREVRDDDRTYCFDCIICMFSICAWLGEIEASQLLDAIRKEYNCNKVTMEIGSWEKFVKNYRQLMDSKK